MVQLNVAKIREVSNASEIRREEIYRMLTDLEKMGLIEKVLGKPIRIKATPINVALSILIEREKQRNKDRLSALIDKKENFFNDFDAFNLQQKRRTKDINFSLITGREAIISKGLNLLDGAEREISITTSLDGLRMTQNLLLNNDEIVKKAVSKGVKIRIVINTSDYDNPIFKSLNEHSEFIDLKYSNQPLNHYAIMDHKEALISTSTEPILEDSPDLWTNNSNLIEILKADFERVWNTSVTAKDLTYENTQNFSRVIHSLKPTNHVMFSYSNTEEKHNVLFTYIQIGLDNDEVAVYITTEETADQIREAMRRFGIDIEKYEKTGVLHIVESRYNPSEGFDITSTIDYLKNFYDEALTNGFKGCRICGEMEYFFKNNLIEKMMEYETTLTRLFITPIIGICAFNKNTINDFNDPLNLYCELVLAHSNVLTMKGDKLIKVDIRPF